MNKISSRENFSTGKRGRGKMLANFVNLSSVPFSSSSWRVATLGFFLFFFSKGSSLARSQMGTERDTL